MKKFTYPPHIITDDSRDMESDEEFTFFILDLFDKPAFDTRRRGDSNDDPTKGQFTNACGFVLEVHDTKVPELLQRLRSHLETRHLLDILHETAADLKFELDPDAQQENINRRNKLRVRIMNDPEKATKMTLKALKYREVGSLPDPIN